jgi:hypothetical protein
MAPRDRPAEITLAMVRAGERELLDWSRITDDLPPVDEVVRAIYRAMQQAQRASN